jgi:hypothetical protein
VSLRLYLDQNYLSGIVKRKPAFAELEPVLRHAVAFGVVEVVESAVHEREALAIALTRCDLVTYDAFMADVIRRARLDRRHRCELFTGQRADVLRLGDRLGGATPPPRRESARVTRSAGRPSGRGAGR